MGEILIYAAFVSALISSVSFFLVRTGKIQNIHSIARFFFHVAAIATISSAAYLL
jgi:hypothetical protein